MRDDEWFDGAIVDEDERLMERCHWRRIGFAIFIGILLAMILGPLYGCAEDRWLTKEEDAEMRAACEPYGGCMLVPNPLWKKIQQLLGMDDA